MTFPYIVLAGISGTLLMTLFMRLASVVTGYNFNVPVLLGTLLTMNTQPSGALSRKPSTIIFGYVIHYLLGIFLSFTFYTMLAAMTWPDTPVHALVFGAIAGAAAVLFWLMMLSLHPMAPAINRKLYLVLIFIAHFVFATGTHYGGLAAFRIFSQLNTTTTKN